ncbi:hypothetical protein AURDEDRAFT_164294 [Auricularia subglabra TFB-10046 SS5]|nr:hypothetical protein AURDEDRAFT_164294 [Auricularia subglabra TFB-10046 SS5]
MLGICIVLVLRALASAIAEARLANVTIDDQYGDARMGRMIEYHEQWIGLASVNRSDVGFKVPNPDLGEVQNGTLHMPDPSGRWSDPQFLLEFEGSGIYVFFALYGRTTAELMFVLDGGIGTVMHYPNPTTHSSDGFWTYRQLVFEMSNLPHKLHNLFIVNSAKNQSVGVFFDYAVYVTDVLDDAVSGNTTSSITVSGSSSPTSPSQKHLQHRSRSSVTIICASLVGVFLPIVGVLCYLNRRRKLHSATTTAWSDDAGRLQPYPAQLPPPGKGLFAPTDEKPCIPQEKIHFEKVSPLQLAIQPDVAELELEPGPPHAETSDDTRRLRAELERMREENEMWRQTAGPPPEYADGERIESAE